MMAQKHLHELLQEDQEPFLLKNYIDDRRCLLKKSSLRNQLQIKKRKPISQSSQFPYTFCKNACFFSFDNSPDPRKSPLFEFQSPAKTPCRSPNAIFLQIPARTAALLLEAALRIQKQQSSTSKNKSNGFGLFGSLLKRLTDRNKTRKREISGDGIKVSVKEILRWDSSVGRRRSFSGRDGSSSKQMQKMGINEKSASERSAFEMGFSCSCNGRPSSAGWSESNEEKSLDFTSSSSQSEEDFVGFVNQVIDDSVDFASYNKHFCESPFHFVLQRSPSSGHRTPDFNSPATFPSRNIESKESNIDVGSLKKFQVEGDEEVEEEDKEQFSPVSVLDPPFEDDDDGHDDHGEDEGFDDLNCGYAIVQRAKHQLLQKLCRFEKLAGLDPVELEKRMMEQEVQEENKDNGSEDKVELKNIDQFVIEELNKSCHKRLRKIPQDMKRLVSDLIEEERRELNYTDDEETTVKRVCKRFESWKQVESNTIDMMIEQDFKREVEGWKRNQEQVDETALEIELGIFVSLVDELAEELVV